MARPTKRDPRQNLATEAPATLTPAPDNGATFGSSATKTARPGRQLGQRIPEELYDRAAACTAETGIPLRTLLIRGLEAELTRQGF